MHDDMAQDLWRPTPTPLLALLYITHSIPCGTSSGWNTILINAVSDNMFFDTLIGLIKSSLNISIQYGLEALGERFADLGKPKSDSNNSESNGRDDRPPVPLKLMFALIVFNIFLGAAHMSFFAVRDKSLL